MKIKKQKNMRLIKVGLSTFALIGAIGITVPNLSPVAKYATIEASTDLENKQVINLETSWKYLDNNVDPANGDVAKATDWTKTNYDDSSWKEDKGSFGAKKGVLADLGGGSIPTVLLKQYYEDKKDIPTYFFRTKFNVENLSHVTSILSTLKADDGVVLYLNGKKIAEANMTTNGVVAAPNMYYAGTGGGNPAEIEVKVNKDEFAGVLTEGENTLAVELHNDREASSDIYFAFSDLTLAYAEEGITQKAVSLTVGSDETQNNLTWYANTSAQGEVQIAKKKDVVNNVFPASTRSIKATSNPSADGNFYSNQVTINQLEANTAYVYRLVNGTTVSESYTFTTGTFGENFSFILAGDPQIGSSGSVEADTINWNDTLRKAAAQFKPNFLVTAGDQVNVQSAENEYAGYLNAEALTSLPSATTIGNHDSKSVAYQEHFNLPNEDVSKGATPAGYDYWYVYNNTLFMDINTNNKSIAEHKAFMEEAIAKNPNVRWKTVVFHHSVYSTASHTNDSEIINLRNALPPIFSELDIDVVLQGHDHVYTRTYMMDGLVPQSGQGVQSSVVDPTGVLYLTANSASGSKYYDIKAPDAAFAAKMDQSKRRTITDINVSENQYTLTTYFVDDMSVLDTFTINKTALLNEKEEILTPKDGTNLSVNVSLKVPAQTIEQGSLFDVQEIMTENGYTSVQDCIKQTLGSEKDFKFLQLDVLKNGHSVPLRNTSELTFALPKGYKASEVKLYRYMETAALEEVAYEIKDNTVVITAKQLGNFVLVNNQSSESTDQTPITPERPSNGGGTITPTNDEKLKTVATGDHTNLIQLLLLALTGMVALCLAMRVKRNSKA